MQHEVPRSAMAVPILLTKLDGFALLMAGSLGAIAFAMTLQFIELEAFQTKDYVFPVIVMLYLYTRNAHRFTEEPAAAPPPCDEPPIVAPPSESRAPPSDGSMRCARFADALARLPLVKCLSRDPAPPPPSFPLPQSPGCLGASRTSRGPTSVGARASSSSCSGRVFVRADSLLASLIDRGIPCRRRGVSSAKRACNRWTRSRGATQSEASKCSPSRARTPRTWTNSSRK